MKEIPNMRGYYADEMGNIFRLHGGEYIQKKFEKRNHPVVRFCIDGVDYQRVVGRVIAETFIGPPPEGKPFVLYRDGNKYNCSLSNLYYASREECFIPRSLAIAERRSLAAEEKKRIKIENENTIRALCNNQAIELNLRISDRYPTYPVSECGDVYWFSPTGLVKKVPFDTDRGYAKVTTGRKDTLVHRIVAFAYLGEPPVGKEQVCHRDGNPYNNCAYNLYWGSAQDNAEDGMRHGTKGRKLTHDKVLEIRRSYPEEGYKKLAKRFGVNRTTIRSVIRGDTWYLTK